MTATENFYNILGVNENASGEEIKKAYRSLSMKWHPDKNRDDVDAVSKFQKISEAYETLGDEKKREEYNMIQNNPFLKRMNGMGNMGGGMNMSGMGGMNMSGMGGLEIPLDLFGALFGMGAMPSENMFNVHGFPGGGVHVFHGANMMNPNMMNPNMKRLQKPTPIIKNITVSIEHVLIGSTVPVDIERWIIENGTKVFEKETIYVDIPKGIDDNEMIILRDKGNSMNELNKGDIKLFVHVENNTPFKRSGLDLIFEKSISLKDALCGFSFEIKYINGKSYTINNNSGNIIQPNYRKMIPNMGLVRDEHKGNLIIIFTVEFPEKLTSDQMKQLREVL